MISYAHLSVLFPDLFLYAIQNSNKNIVLHMSLAAWARWAFSPIRYTISIITWLLAPEPAELPNILAPSINENLEKSVFFLTDDGRASGKALGVGFCVGNKNKAITSYHNLTTPQVGTRVRGFFGAPYIGQFLDMEITYESATLDFVVLQIISSSFPHKSLPVCKIIPTRGTDCILVAFQISLVEQLIPDITTHHSVGVYRGAVVRVHNQHFAYDAPSFSGDSGGAVIVQGGQVIGMHIETINQAREHVQRASSTVNGHLNDVEASVDSLTQGLSSGCIALKAASFASVVCIVIYFRNRCKC